MVALGELQVSLDAAFLTCMWASHTMHYRYQDDRILAYELVFFILLPIWGTRPWGAHSSSTSNYGGRIRVAVRGIWLG